MNTTPISNYEQSPYQRLEPCYMLQPLGCYLLFVWIIGTLLNGFILYVFIRYKNLRQTSTNIFICGLVFADFLGSCFSASLPTIALLECRWIFGRFGCVAEAIIAYFSGCSNMYMLCLISVDRYFVVTRSFSTPIITTTHAYITIGCAYLLALFWALMPMVGWSEYGFEGVGASCSIKWEGRSLNVTSYNVAIFMFVYLIPVTIIIATNINAYNVIRERRRRASINLNESHAQRQYLIERRITFTVMFIVVGFLVAWTPYTIMAFIYAFIDSNIIPPILGTIPALFAKTSVVWNPLIYVARNGNIRHYLPFCASPRTSERNRTSDQTRYSIYPFSSVQLPLSSTPSSRQT